MSDTARPLLYGVAARQVATLIDTYGYATAAALCRAVIRDSEPCAYVSALEDAFGGLISHRPATPAH